MSWRRLHQYGELHFIFAEKHICGKDLASEVNNGLAGGYCLACKEKAESGPNPHLGPLARLLGPGFEQRMEQHLYNVARRTWAFQPIHIRKNRLEYIRRLSAAADRLREAGVNFCMAFTDHIIEGVITGDAAEILSWVNFLTFADEDERTRLEYEPIYASFRALATEAAASLAAIEFDRDADASKRPST